MNIYDPDEDYLDRHHGEGPDDWYGADDLEQLTEIVGQRDLAAAYCRMDDMEGYNDD